MLLFYGDIHNLNVSAMFERPFNGGEPQQGVGGVS